MVLVPRYSGSTTTTDVSPSTSSASSSSAPRATCTSTPSSPSTRASARVPDGPGLSGSIGIEVWAPVPSTMAMATAATRARPMRSDERCRRTSPGSATGAAGAVSRVVVIAGPPGRRRGPARSRPARGWPAGRRTSTSSKSRALPCTRSAIAAYSRARASATSWAVAPGVSDSRPRSTCRTATARNPSTTASSNLPASSAASARARSSSAVTTSSVRTARFSSLPAAVRRARETSQASASASATKISIAMSVESGGACEARSRPLPILRISQLSTCRKTFCWWYSGWSSSRRSLERASEPDGSRGGSGSRPTRAARATTGGVTKP